MSGSDEKMPLSTSRFFAQHRQEVTAMELKDVLYEIRAEGCMDHFKLVAKAQRLVSRDADEHNCNFDDVG